MAKNVFDDIIMSAAGTLLGKGAAGIDIPLSGDSANILVDLISQGVFKDKGDFTGFIIKALMDPNIRGMLGKDGQLPVGDIINFLMKSGILNNMSTADMKDKMVPLMVDAFKVAGPLISKYMGATKPA